MPAIYTNGNIKESFLRICIGNRKTGCYISEKYTDDSDEQTHLYNSFVGQDVIYIHTRCGDCGMGYDNEESNYVYCGAKDWEEKHKDLFIEHITDPFDQTYCTHFFKAVVNDEYEEALKVLEEAYNEAEEEYESIKDTEDDSGDTEENN